ncbi:MAG: phosphoribosyl-AMP cyclohydrolase [Bacillota bacterium]
MKDFTFLKELKFGADGLIPAIVQDNKTGQVLMIAYMNREAVARTWETGETWFYSRSRQELWHKGETSGHFQRVRGISFDCDQDALLVKVEQTGAACHTGYQSCFYREITPSGEVQTIGERVFNPEEVYGEPPGIISPELLTRTATVTSKGASNANLETTKPAESIGVIGIVGPETEPQASRTTPAQILAELYQVILERRQTRPEGSYTAYLFNKGVDKICKKVGEEAAEVIIAAKNASREELIYESADLIYHLLVLLADSSITPDEVFKELAKRR